MSALLSIQKDEINQRIDFEYEEEEQRKHTLDGHFKNSFGTKRDALYLADWRAAQVPRHPTGLITRSIAMNHRRITLFLHDVEILYKAEQKTRNDIHTEEGRTWNTIVLSSITSSCKYDANAEFYEAQWEARGFVECQENIARTDIENVVPDSVHRAELRIAQRLHADAAALGEIERTYDSERTSIYIDQISTWVSLQDDAKASAVRVGHIMAWRAMNDEARCRWDIEKEVEQTMLDVDRGRRFLETMMESMTTFRASLSPEKKAQSPEAFKVLEDGDRKVEKMVSPNKESSHSEEAKVSLASSQSPAIPVEKTSRTTIIARRPESQPEAQKLQGTAIAPSVVEESYDVWWNALDEVRAETQRALGKV